MVFTSIVNFIRTRGPDEFWRKRRIFKLSAVSVKLFRFSWIFFNLKLCLKHFYGRRRNCYKLAIRSVNRAMQFSTINRDLKKQDLEEVRWHYHNDLYNNNFLFLKLLLLFSYGRSELKLELHNMVSTSITSEMLCKSQTYCWIVKCCLSLLCGSRRLSRLSQK